MEDFFCLERLCVRAYLCPSAQLRVPNRYQLFSLLATALGYILFFILYFLPKTFIYSVKLNKIYLQ